MGDTIVEGILREKNFKDRSIRIDDKMYPITERSLEFAPAVGTRVTITIGRENTVYFIAEAAPEPPKPKVRAEEERVIRKDGTAGIRTPTIRSELMKNCLLESANVWNDLIGSKDKPGPLQTLVMQPNGDGVPELNGDLVIEKLVATAQSLFIDATKENRMDRMGYG